MSDHTAFPPHPMVSKETALLVASLASFLTPFMGSSINVALQMIGNELGASAVLLGWVPTSYLLTSSVLLIPIGRLADIYGRRKVFLGGILLHTLSSLPLRHRSDFLDAAGRQGAPGRECRDDVGDRHGRADLCLSRA